MKEEHYIKKLLPWVAVAMSEIGEAEVPGDKNNPRILEYHSCTTLKATQDFVAWCSAFMCWVMECSGIASTRSALARSWCNWGEELHAPKFGCIVVLTRGTNQIQGHVGLVLGWDSTRIYVLGGNQGDQVSIAAYLKTSVLSYRWPIIVVK